MSALKVCLAVLALSAVASVRFWQSSGAEPVQLTVEPARIAADGYTTATVAIVSPSVPRLTLAQSHGVTLSHPKQATAGVWHATLRAGVDPGTLTLRAQTDTGSAETHVVLTPSLADREGDGTPDALQLDTDQDRAAFRRWFTFLAEAQFFQRASSRPAEINDCAALIRYAYRESLRKHDAGWIAEAKLPIALALDPVAKYQYPHTLLGASLFRVKPGRFEAADLADGSFSQFADAKTLQTINTHFVSRDIRRAEPGDLLFFRHVAADMPFHSMIYLGASQIHNDGARYLLYHTGPDGSDPGEIRRPTIEELAAHPNPGWHPSAGNPTFLGVYRWNILR